MCHDVEGKLLLCSNLEIDIWCFILCEIRLYGLEKSSWFVEEMRDKAEIRNFQNSRKRRST